ncbi:hypothetical protein [Actinomadura bangladeshensis]|uniref:Uncharacterized protein n=1 Tax=Actinomadura bangladeshensis TaxID=453573 RepID=A0A6L9QC72_9ACTN|nr:hypothetical protein [Actinomadura bangladeshensis]NEA22668.1 hypothetical protein [Actinomadura bangladeshensis]
MKIADLGKLPEGTPLRTTAGDIVTLAAIGRSRVVVRDADGHTHEYAGVSVHTVPDPYPLVKGLRRGLTGRTITVERVTRTVAYQWRPSVPNWEGLIGRRCAVEREDGKLRQVHDFEDSAYAAGAEDMAQLVARQRDARYIPAEV